MSLLDIHLKSEYRSLSDNVVADFYIPVLRESVLYQRASGFFSSSALIALSQGIEGLIKNGGKIQMIASPRLSPEDLEEISRGYEIRAVMERALLREMEMPVPDKELNRLSYIATLIAEGVLDIKIAFLSSHNTIAMYHEKMGIMSDREGNVLAFSGSMNESENSFLSNYESFDVFCSWTGDQKRVAHKQQAFSNIWNDQEPGVDTIEFPQAVKERIYDFNAELRTSNFRGSNSSSVSLTSPLTPEAGPAAPLEPLEQPEIITTTDLTAELPVPLSEEKIVPEEPATADQVTADNPPVLEDMAADKNNAPEDIATPDETVIVETEHLEEEEQLDLVSELEPESEIVCEPEPKGDIYLPDDFQIRPYQKEAIQNWQRNQYCGIYDMATGTGKTLTALASLEQLYRDNNHRLGIIIVCPYQHLVEQWVEDIVRFGIRPITGYSSSPQRDWDKRLQDAARSFNLRMSNTFCFVTTNATFGSDTVQEVLSNLSDDVVLVVDEAHNMGATGYRKNLPQNIRFRLALSATLERHHDEEGTQALAAYFGEKCIVYTLQDAINSHMLTSYYYHPVVTYLDPEELNEYLELTAQLPKTMNSRNGKITLSDRAKQLLIQRANVIAGARNKITALQKHIAEFTQDKHILVYCGATTVTDPVDGTDKRQIDLVAEMLGNTLNMRVGRFTSQETAQERVQIREAFAKGDMLQVLVAIKCLDEGVNIPSIKTAFILASSTNPKEYIQRRGRVLRKFPGKNYAVIYDFITLPFPFETLLSQPENTVSSTRGLIRRELVRMWDFAQIARNPSEALALMSRLKQGFNISDLNESAEEWE